MCAAGATTARFWSRADLRKPPAARRLCKKILLKEVVSASAGHPQNTGKPWNKEEEAQLLQEFRCGTDIPGLAQHHGRTEKAIRKRLELLGEIEVCNE